MPDYDVSAEGLASPPALAPVTTYYPAALVKNNGVHPANVTGYIRIYSKATGLLVAQHQVSRNNIQPGTTESVPSATPWVLTPEDIGKQFILNGVVSAPLDSVPGNNNFGPVIVTVTGATPPPPPIETHASQHENGGADELDLTGLAGKLAEHQDPTEHASAHEDGGSDQLSVDGLNGELADPQTPKTHAGSHGVGGSDPVIGIPPTAHAETHEEGAADELSDAQYTSEKDQANGYAGLDANAEVPAAHLDGHDELHYPGQRGAIGGALLNYANDQDTTGTTCPTATPTVVAQVNASDLASSVSRLSARGQVSLEPEAESHNIDIEAWIRVTSTTAPAQDGTRAKLKITDIGDGWIATLTASIYSVWPVNAQYVQLVVLNNDAINVVTVSQMLHAHVQAA